MSVIEQTRPELEQASQPELEQPEQEEFATLAQEVEKFIRTYAVLGDDEALVLAHYVIHTWCFDAAYVTPYLYINGQKASGKTCLLEALEVLCQNAWRASQMSLPAMFRQIETDRPTLLFDEIDRKYGGRRHDDLSGLLDAGYREGDYCVRQEKLNNRKFSTFCPKVLAGIRNGHLPDTVEDRCIPISMKPKGKDDKVTPLRRRYVQHTPQYNALLDRLKRFAEYAYVDLALSSREPIEALSDRQSEVSETLLAIAAVIGGERELREALVRIFAQSGKQPSPETALLERIREAFGDRQRIGTAELCEHLGRGWNGRQLAIQLERFSIAPKKIRLPNSNTTVNGYERTMFTEVFNRYFAEDAVLPVGEDQ